jgi:hypothetical protein
MRESVLCTDGKEGRKYMTFSLIKQIAALRSEFERLLNKDEASLKAALLSTETDTLAREAGLTAERFLNTELVFLANDCVQIQARLQAWSASQTGVSAVDFGLPPQQPDKEVEGPLTRCSFCGKGPEQAEQIIYSRNNAAICNECVELCQEMLHIPSGA